MVKKGPSSSSTNGDFSVNFLCDYLPTKITVIHLVENNIEDTDSVLSFGPFHDIVATLC